MIISYFVLSLKINYSHLYSVLSQTLIQRNTPFEALGTSPAALLDHSVDFAGKLSNSPLMDGSSSIDDSRLWKVTSVCCVCWGSKSNFFFSWRGHKFSD